VLKLSQGLSIDIGDQVTVIIVS